MSIFIILSSLCLLSSSFQVVVASFEADPSSPFDIGVLVDSSFPLGRDCLELEKAKG